MNLLHHTIPELLFPVFYIVQTPFKTLSKLTYGSKYISIDSNKQQLIIYITNKSNNFLYNFQFFTYLHNKLLYKLLDILLIERYCTCRLQ